MTRTPRTQESALRRFIDGLGQCTRNDLMGLIQDEEITGDARICTCLAALCTFEERTQRPHETLYGRPLDALADSGHPMAEAALLHLAQSCRINRIRVEAARRLGRIATGKKAREFLREAAEDGTIGSTNFQNDKVTSTTMKAAALQSLGELKRPTKTDTELVIQILRTEAQSAANSEPFRAGARALANMAKPSDISEIIELAEVRSDHDMVLQLLSVCGGFPRASFQGHERDIARLLYSSLEGYRDEEPYRTALPELARQASCAELIRGVSQRYRDDHLSRGRGRISAAALAGYPRPDAALVDACLAFARSESNVFTDSPCIRGLALCAKAGKAEHIVKQVFSHRHPGYDKILGSTAMLDILGTVQALVDRLCDAIVATDIRRVVPHLTATCCESMIRASLAHCKEAPSFASLKALVEEAAHSATESCDPVADLASRLSNVEPKRNALSILAKRIVRACSGDGAIKIAAHLLGLPSQLAHLFLKELFTTAASVNAERARDPSADSALLQVEELAFGKHQAWVEENLERLLLRDGKLNTYILHAARRRIPGFAAKAMAVVPLVTCLGDMKRVLEAIALTGNKDAVQSLVGAVAYESPSGQMIPEVRTKAIELAGRLVAEAKGLDAEKTRHALLERVHERFEDVLPVRLAAYAVAGAMAAPGSIVFLKGRLTTDRNERGKRAVEHALAAIRQRLIDNRPERSDPQGLRSWLGNVGALEDGRLLSHVLKLLAPPHSDQEVLVAALGCVGQLGDRDGIEAIDAFLSNTSPSGRVLQAARMAKARLQDRHDLSFLESLSAIFPEDSPVLNLAIRYDSMLGRGRITRLSRALASTLEQWHAEHWDDCLCCLDGVCDVLVRHVYENCWERMGIEENQARKLAAKQYGNRLNVSQFRSAFPALQSMFSTIHELRQEARTAHVEDADGGEKQGVRKEDAEFALNTFRAAFIQLVERVLN